jgi:hypothetical protein
MRPSKNQLRGFDDFRANLKLGETNFKWGVRVGKASQIEAKIKIKQSKNKKGGETTNEKLSVYARPSQEVEYSQ